MQWAITYTTEIVTEFVESSLHKLRYRHSAQYGHAADKIFIGSTAGTPCSISSVCCGHCAEQVAQLHNEELLMRY